MDSTYHNLTRNPHQQDDNIRAIKHEGRVFPRAPALYLSSRWLLSCSARRLTVIVTIPLEVKRDSASGFLNSRSEVQATLKSFGQFTNLKKRQKPIGLKHFEDKGVIDLGKTHWSRQEVEPFALSCLLRAKWYIRPLTWVGDFTWRWSLCDQWPWGDKDFGTWKFSGHHSNIPVNNTVTRNEQWAWKNKTHLFTARSSPRNGFNRS